MVARVLVVGLAVLGFAATAAPLVPAAPRCTDAAARSAIRYAKPRFAALGPPQTFRAKAADQIVCFDANGDGLADMAVSLFSGGTAGDVGWVFFVAKPDGWRLAGSGAGYKLGLRLAGTKLEVVQPVYRKSDPNCCPTGGFDRTLYGWNGHRLAALRTWIRRGRARLRAWTSSSRPSSARSSRWRVSWPPPRSLRTPPSGTARTRFRASC